MVSPEAVRKSPSSFVDVRVGDGDDAIEVAIGGFAISAERNESLTTSLEYRLPVVTGWSAWLTISTCTGGATWSQRYELGVPSTPTT